MKIIAMFFTMFSFAFLGFSEPEPTLFSKSSETEIVTNSWGTAINNWENGTNVLGCVPSRWLLVCSNYNDDGSLFATNYFVASYQYQCTKDHVEDYPKTSSSFYGVQKHVVLTYKEGEAVIVKKDFYEKPSRKFEVRVTTAIKFVVSTNRVEISRERW